LIGIGGFMANAARSVQARLLKRLDCDLKRPGMPETFVAAALYKFVRLEDCAKLRGPALAAMKANGIKGTLLLAPEGINGTISGARAGIDAFLAWLKSDARFSDLEHKESHCSEQPFYRAKVKLKKEIVTMGDPSVNPADIVGTYVAPKDWNALISDPDVLLIDTRNDYEVKIGTFEGAVNPATGSFSEFPGFVATSLADARNRKIAMFCTGGIRCEKASSYMRAHGFRDVHHLKGGILKYLEEVPAADSRWQGDCFVFDQRVAVGQGLKPSGAELCYGCRVPLEEGARQSPLFEEGVSCPRCAGAHSEVSKASARERHRQMKLAEARGQRKPIGTEE
jgi:UPF0176 protein